MLLRTVDLSHDFALWITATAANLLDLSPLVFCTVSRLRPLKFRCNCLIWLIHFSFLSRFGLMEAVCKAILSNLSWLHSEVSRILREERIHEFSLNFSESWLVERTTTLASWAVIAMTVVPLDLRMSVWRSLVAVVSELHRPSTLVIIHVTCVIPYIDVRFHLPETWSLRHRFSRSVLSQMIRFTLIIPFPLVCITASCLRTVILMPKITHDIAAELSVLLITRCLFRTHSSWPCLLHKVLVIVVFCRHDVSMLSNVLVQNFP